MFSLVGNRRGQKVIRWGSVVVVFLLITVSAAMAAAGLYGLLARQWNSLVLLVGPVAGIVATAFTLAVALRTPVQRLPMMK